MCGVIKVRRDFERLIVLKKNQSVDEIWMRFEEIVEGGIEERGADVV